MTARPINLQKTKLFRPGSAASNNNRSTSITNTNSTALNTNNHSNATNTINLNKLSVSTPGTTQLQSAAPHTGDINNGVIRERVPIYAPTNDQLQQYYYVAKFMSSAISETNTDKKLSRSAKLYKPVRSKHKSYALIKQEKKLERARNKQLKKQQGNNNAGNDVDISSDSDNEESSVLRKWRIEDNKRNLSFVGTAEQLRSSVSRDDSGINDYCLLVMQHDANNRAYFDMIPISRFINFRSEEQYQHYRSLDEAEAYMKQSAKLGDRWMSRSTALNKYETVKLLDMEERGIELDRELMNHKLIDNIDDDKLIQRYQKLEQQRSRLKHDDDSDRRIKKERANDFTDKFSDDEGVELHDDKDDVDGVESDSSAVFDDETEQVQTNAGKRSTELLQKQDLNQLPQSNATQTEMKSNKNNDMMDDESDSGVDDGR